MQYQYYSQIGQDKFIDELLKGKVNGTFADVGSYDGIIGNNTYFFEQYRNWNGICIEPIPSVFQKLKHNRQCMVFNGCIYNENLKNADFLVNKGYTEMLSGLVDNFDKKHMERIDNEINQFGGSKEIINVSCYRLDTLLKKINVSYVDYCSIDVECTEKMVLESINFDETYIHCFSIENNNNDNNIRNFMKDKGYKHITYLANQDDIFVKEVS
jgi:FkbM family methyltransferase